MADLARNARDRRPGAHPRRGRGNFRGDSDAVLALRRQAVKVTPNDAIAHLNLAATLEGRQERGEAAREYETARMLGQVDAGLQRTVALAFARMGLLREAIEVAEYAVRLEPRDDDLRVDLGDLYSKMGMPVTNGPRATTRPRGCGSRPRESPEPRPSLRNPG
jgi:Flp pilus assembly protein TadD